MVTLRAALEGFAARFVAASFSPEIETRLRGLLTAGRAAAEEGRTSDWRDLDWQFHEAVVAAAENPYLLSAWSGIGKQIRLFLHTHPVFVVEIGATLANHDTLFSALVSGDPDRAEASFRRVILGSAFRRFDRELPAALSGLHDSKPEGAALRGKRGVRAG